MKIVIVDAYHDSDRGGAGILAGLLNIIGKISRDRDQPIDVAVVYRMSRGDPRFATAARHTRRSYPNVAVHGAPFRTFRRYRGALSGRIESLCALLWSMGRLAFPSLSSDPAVKAIRCADIVLSKGGHFYQFWETDALRGFLKAHKAYYALLLAMRLRKRFALLAHTMGPFRNGAARWLTRFVCRRAIHVSTREEISKQALVDLGVSPAKVEVLPDTAFALIPVSRAESARLLKSYGLRERDYVVLTARYWPFPDHSRRAAGRLYRRYLRGMANIADRALEQGLAGKVALAVHNDGRHDSTEDDSQAVREILRMMKAKDRAVVIDDDLSPAQQAGLYGRAKLMVGTRMHSVIFALLGGAPALAVSYTHKAEGMMQMLGLADYVLRIDELGPAGSDAALRRLSRSGEEIVRAAQRKIGVFRAVLTSRLEALLASSGANA